MNKKTWWVIGSILVLIVGAGAYVYFAKDATETRPTQEARHDTGKQPAEQNDTSIKGRYVDYSPEAIAGTRGDIILFFHAPWCPQCRAAEASIKSASLPDNLTIFKVDYDTNQALRQQYGVTLQTTFVKVDESGGKLESFVAYDEPTFDAVKRELLP
jgi:thiol-disulfide isomerase/thioredoxin